MIGIAGVSMRGAAHNIPLTPPVRYRAAAMGLAAYLDEKCVEMHILTDTGKAVTVVCDQDSIFSVQRHIEQMRRACPEISTWKSIRNTDSFQGNTRRAYEAAMWEGWPLPQRSPRGY
jgi:hypothetical protein